MRGADKEGPRGSSMTAMALAVILCMIVRRTRSFVL